MFGFVLGLIFGAIYVSAIIEYKQKKEAEQRLKDEVANNSYDIDEIKKRLEKAFIE